MGLRFQCSDCGRTYEVDPRWAGKRAKCEGCGNLMQVPAGAAAARSYAAPTLTEDAPDQSGIPPIVIKLVAGILAIGLIACVWIAMGNRSRPEAPASPQANTNLPTVSTGALASPTPIQTVRFPQQRNIKLQLPGVEIYSMVIDGSGPGLPMHIRLYLPTNRHEDHSLPCVFIAPAGTRFLYGSALGDGDTPEHLPYARQGFAVLAYELSGDLPDDSNGSVTFGKMKGPVQQFMAADAGLANARLAVDFVLAKVPEVDPAQLFAAGHSSAATMALNAVTADHRFHAVAAYAPGCDVVARWGNDLPRFNHFLPGASALAERVSPIRHVNDINCPVLLFHADDDQNVLTSDITAYADALQSAGKTVTFQRVATGGHYQSMIDQGIGDGIAFFKAQGAKPLPPVTALDSH